MILVDSMALSVSVLQAIRGTYSWKYYNLNIVSEEVLNFGAMEASSQVLNLKRAKADYVFHMGTVGTSSALLREARKMGYKAAFFDTMYGCDEDVVRMVGKAARNFYGAHQFSAWHDESPGMAELKEITLRYHPESKEPKYVEGFGSNRYYTKGWLGALILAEGAKNAGRGLNHETLVAGLEKIRDFDTGGLSGQISFGPDRRKANDCGKFYKADVEKQRFVAISGWIRPTH